MGVDTLPSEKEVSRADVIEKSDTVLNVHSICVSQ